MAARVSYQQIREQLINLNVDLEDKAKVCKILEQKSRDERSLLGLLDAQYDEKFQHIIEEEIMKYQNFTNELGEETNELLKKKKSLVSSCKNLLESLKNKEEKNFHENQRMNTDIELAIEDDKKKFRSGKNERLQAYLIKKTNEIKESTAQATSSDFKRIEINHEQDVLDMERKYKSEERKLREGMRNRLNEMVSEEELIMKDELRNSLRTRAEASAVALNVLSDDHRQRMRDLTEDDGREVESLNREHLIRAEKDRKQSENDTKKCHDEYLYKIKDIQLKNQSELYNIEKDHNEQLRVLNTQAVKEKNNIERRIIESQDVYSPGKSSKLNGYEEDIRERDKRLKTEIRLLQSETVRQERVLRVKHDEEKEFTLASRNKEQEVSQKKQRQLTDEISQYVLEREDVLTKIKDRERNLAGMKIEYESIQRDIVIYENGIQGHVLRAIEVEELYKTLEKEEKLSFESKEKEMESEYEYLNEKDETAVRMHQKALEEMTAERNRRLDELDIDIKNDVTNKDNEIKRLQDLIETEQIKTKRLDTLIRKYTLNIGTTGMAPNSNISPVKKKRKFKK